MLKVDHSNPVSIDFGKELIQYWAADGDEQGDTLFEFIQRQHSILIGVPTREQQLGGTSLSVHGCDDGFANRDYFGFRKIIRFVFWRIELLLSLELWLLESFATLSDKLSRINVAQACVHIKMVDVAILIDIH